MHANDKALRLFFLPSNQHSNIVWRCMGWIWENREESKERQNESVTMSCKSKTSIFISSYYSRFYNCYVVGYKLNLLKDFSSTFRARSMVHRHVLGRKLWSNGTVLRLFLAVDNVVNFAHCFMAAERFAGWRNCARFYAELWSCSMRAPCSDMNVWVKQQ